MKVIIQIFLIGSLSLAYSEPCKDVNCDLGVIKKLLKSGKRQNKEIESRIVRSSDRVIGLDLSRLQLSKIPKILGNLTALTSLDLSENDLGDLPESIENLKNLQNTLTLGS